MSEVLNLTLPDDIVADILLRLPVKPICRFKCVSKPWRSFLSNPQFARAHLKFHKDDPEELILTSSSSDFGPYILTLSAGGSAASDGGVAKKVQSELEVCSVVAGSCHGLVLLALQDEEGSKILFNPITLETAKIIPLETAEALHHLTVCCYGFGYDSSSDDYKVVCLSQMQGSRVSVVNVYSVRMKCWKRTMEFSSYNLKKSLYDCDFAPGVYLNGCLHWLGFDTRKGIPTLLCYDLARDEFEEDLCPFSVHGSFVSEIRVLEGCLALVSDRLLHKTILDVWVMREYGVRDSWIKFTTVCPEDELCLFKEAYNVVCNLSEDEVVVEKNFAKLFAYNRKNGISRDLAIAGLPEGFYRVMPFRRSLLSPN